ncbi:MAG: CoA-binding protein [Planctomycetota bacterium]|nr:MAG: CoA-binding protein [Planctomycetota bacterium]
MSELTKEFFEHGPFAVVGASTKREKYGNKVLRCYLQHDLQAYPINPHADEVEGLPAYPDLNSTPQKPGAISVITPPEITEKLLEQAHEFGIDWVWLQPGAESPKAIAKAEGYGMKLIAGGPCLLVALGFTDK